MGELLFKKWLEKEDIDLRELILYHGINGVLGEFERWLKEKKYIQTTSSTHGRTSIEKYNHYYNDLVRRTG